MFIPFTSYEHDIISIVARVSENRNNLKTRKLEYTNNKSIWPHDCSFITQY